MAIVFLCFCNENQFVTKYFKYAQFFCKDTTSFQDTCYWIQFFWERSNIDEVNHLQIKEKVLYLE